MARDKVHVAMTKIGAAGPRSGGPADRRQGYGNPMVAFRLPDMGCWASDTPLTIHFPHHRHLVSFPRFFTHCPLAIALLERAHSDSTQACEPKLLERAMAQASSSRPEPKSLVEDSDDEATRPSTSTASRRHSHYESQRIGRRSRPVSGGSNPASSSRSQGKQAYSEPADWQNLDEIAAPDPLGPERKESLEQSRSKQISPKSGLETKNSFRRRESGKRDDQGLDEIPPVQREQPSEPPTSSSTNAQQKRRLLDDREAGEGDADDEDSTAPPPFAARKAEDYLHRRKEPPSIPRWLTEIYAVSYLIFFSILGTLARLGLQWLTFYPGTPIVTPVIWANFAGCVFMGFLSEDQTLFQDAWSGASMPTNEKRESARSNMSNFDKINKAEVAKRKKAIPLYIGLATGFCGSLTSFSSFARDFFLALSNNLPTPLNHPNDFTGSSTLR